MKSADVKKFLNEISSHKLVVLHNMYCDATGGNLIYDNDEDFYDNFCDKPMELARGINYGNYNFDDEYVVFNGYGNLDTYNFYTVASIICIDEIVDYYLDEETDNTDFMHFLIGNGYDIDNFSEE